MSKEDGLMKTTRWLSSLALILLAAVAVLAVLVLAGPVLAGPGDAYQAAAYYFPGYHPNPQNDARLGQGWTEWDLMRAAGPRFPGHDQPKVPLWGYLDESRPEVFEKKIAAAAGLKGVHLNAVAWGVKPEGLARDGNDLLERLGFDSVTSYCWIHHVYPQEFPGPPYADWAGRAAAQWEGFRKQWNRPYHPNVSMGWDSSPRTTQSDPFQPVGYPYTPVVRDNTPAEFKRALKKLKAVLDADPRGPKVFTINAWNEWTEGSYLEPDTVHRLGYLEALRDVFGPGSRRGERLE